LQRVRVRRLLHVLLAAYAVIVLIEITQLILFA
jgi:hypothetical protein